MEERTAAIVNARYKKVKLERVKSEILGPIDWGLHCHLQRYKTYESDVLDPGNVLTFGIGPLAGSVIPGTYRLIFFSRSPVWYGLLNSSMGGVGFALYRSGVDFVAVEGKPVDYYAVGFFKNDGNFDYEFVKLNEEDLRLLYFEGYGGKTGIWALQLFALDKFSRYFKNNGEYRTISTGPAALNTRIGALESTVIKGRKLLFGQDDWAGRGGFGSLLVRAHGIFSITFGGNSDEKSFCEDLKDIQVVNEIFRKHFGKTAPLVWREATEKYRYVKAINTGGTFGVNMHTRGLWLPKFNWSSVNFSRKTRKLIQNSLVKSCLKQFNSEVIETKNWRTCGEPCPAVCKKIHVMKKIEYEPFNAVGFNCGVFDLTYIEDIVDFIDTLGFDAISFGTIAGFLLEAISRGLIMSNQINCKVKSNFNPEKFLENPRENSYVHYQMLKIIARIIVSGQGLGRYFTENIREGTKQLDKDLGMNGKLHDLLVYIPHGEKGCISPLQYYVPGVFVPLPIQGKYLTFYGRELLMPQDLANKCVDRFLKEITTENLGICRFHRKWSEKIGDILVEAAVGRKVDLSNKAINHAEKILEYEKKAGNYPCFWETQRVKEIVKKFYKDHSKDVKTSDLEKLVAIFKSEEGLKYWTDVLDSIETNFAMIKKIKKQRGRKHMPSQSRSYDSSPQKRIL